MLLPVAYRLSMKNHSLKCVDPLPHIHANAVVNREPSVPSADCHTSSLVVEQERSVNDSARMGSFKGRGRGPVSGVLQPLLCWES